MASIIQSESLSAAWTNGQDLYRSLKQVATQIKAESLAGPVSATRIILYERDLRIIRDRLQAIAGTSGLAAYVTSLPNTPQGYDVQAEYNTTRTQVVATIQWIRDNFPKVNSGGSDYLLAQSWGADGPVDRTFSTASLAGFRTQLDALLTVLG